MVIGQFFRWMMIKSKKEFEFFVVSDQIKYLMQSDFWDILNSMERTHKFETQLLERL